MSGSAREALERLHALGIGLMLDDFGTGFSSLNYLQMFPLDYVKIDRPFVTRTFPDRANANSGMMPAMLQMASSMGLTAIAEIVETEAAADSLRKMGCEYGQGNFFSEPVQAEVALQYLRGEAVTRRAHAALAAGSPSAAASGASPEDDSPTLMIPIDSQPVEDESMEDSFRRRQSH